MHPFLKPLIKGNNYTYEIELFFNIVLSTFDKKVFFGAHLSSGICQQSAPRNGDLVDRQQSYTQGMFVRV